MKKIRVFIFTAFFLASVMIANPQGFAHAQEPVCRDAAGGVIPCAAKPEKEKEKKTPVPPVIPASTATAASTPLPLTNPTGDVELAGSEWSGSCGLSDLKCSLVFANGCTHVGGSWEIESTSATEVKLKCTVPLVIEPTPMPLTSSGDGATEGKKKDDWSFNCSKGNAALDSSAQLSCVLAATQQCSAEGGSTNGSEDSDGNVTLNCVHLEIEPAPLPLSSVATSTPQPEEGYLGQCTKADGDFFECQKKFTCEDGLLVMKVDLYSGNGTVYDFYCYPHKPNLSIAAIPDNGSTEDNWAGICGGNNAGDNLGNCLDIYAAACAQEGGDYSEWYDEDGSAGVYCQNESEASQPVPTQTALPAVIPADSGSTPPSGWLPWLWLTIGGVIGVMLLPAVQKAREAASSRSPLPPTREHILLNNDNDGTEAGFMKLQDIKGESEATEGK